MNRSCRTFVLVALVGLGLLVLAQAPAQAQFRRPVVPPVPTFRPAAPRAVVTTPPPLVPYTNSFTYLPSGLNLNQAAALNALRIQTRLYNSLYNPYYLGLYPTINYPTVSVTTYQPGIIYSPSSPYPIYNPYFAAFGLYR